MPGHSFLKWFVIALLLPLDGHAVTAAQESFPEFRYLEPDVPAVPAVTQLPAARPDPFRLNRTPPPISASLSRPVPAVFLRFGPQDWRIGELPLGGEHTPVSANLLRAPAAAQRELDESLRAARRQDWQRAEQHLYKALQFYPAYSAAHHNLGVIALLRGSITQGESHIERALELDDHNLYALFSLCQVRLARHDHSGAQRYIERFLTLSPQDPYGLALLGSVQARQGRLDDALRTFAHLDRKEHGALADFHLLAGSIYEVKRDPGRALAEYKKYLRETPEAANRDAVAAAIVKLETFMAAK